MTAPVEEKYDGDTSAEDFITAEEPPEDVSAGEEDAPLGWTRDRETGQMRAKRKAGRPRHQPTPDDPGDAEPVSRAADRAPETGKRRPRTAAAAPDPAMPRGGIIAAGVNNLYRRAGKITRAFDYDIGQALIECARKDPAEPDELTVGEAWEQLCKTNPRVRAFVLRAIAGGAIGDLVMAHAPLGIALVMKPMVQRMIPFGRLAESMAEPDEDAPEGELPGGMGPDDFTQMRELAEQQAARMAAKIGITVTEEQMAEASAAAQQRFMPDGVPPAFARRQPKRSTRAGRGR